MNKKEFLLEVSQKFKNVDINYFEKQIDIWTNTLREENKKSNLTRLDNQELIYQEYFWNSLLPFSLIDLSGNKKILDIGSGSGIPGILLKLVFKDLKLTIIESNSKKCNFMKLLATNLGLNDIEIVNDRCEDYAHTVIEQFDFVTCRAVAELKIILELGIPVLKINGKAIFLKALNYQQEIDNSKKIQKELGLNDPIIQSFITEKTLVTLIYTKDKKTSNIYPRKWKDIIS